MDTKQIKDAMKSAEDNFKKFSAKRNEFVEQLKGVNNTIKQVDDELKRLQGEHRALTSLLPKDEKPKTVEEVTPEVVSEPETPETPETPKK